MYQKGNTIVEITHGKLKGCIGKDWKNNEFHGFLSIPYAKPPIENLKFQDPQEIESWTGVYNATTDLPMALQINTTDGSCIGTEDCLYLNVFTPKLPPDVKKLMPVLFFIHGGGFNTGSASSKIYGPHFLIDQQLVLVFINYRLQIFGMLSDQDGSFLPGNYCLKDQLMALKWVKQNITSFGGDPNNVTLLGESSGAACVHYHMLSPQSAGLFHKIILLSGTALSSWATGVRNSFAKKLKQLGIPNDDPNEALIQLQRTDPTKLLKLQNYFPFVTLTYESETTPVIEPQKEPAPFITDMPLNTVRSGNYSKVPLMLGYNDKDGATLHYISQTASDENQRLLDLNDWDTTIAKDFHVTDKATRKEIAEKIKEYYGNQHDFNRKHGKHKDEAYINLFGDIFVAYHTVFAALEHLKTMDEPIYLYRFSTDTKLNNAKKMFPEIKVKGAYHGDALNYIFKHYAAPEIKPGSMEEISVSRITRIWGNFLKYGNPTPLTDPVLPEKWLPLQKDAINGNEIGYYHIGNYLNMTTNPDWDRYSFWKNMYDKYQRK